MIISLVSPCATVGAYKLMQGQETFYGTVIIGFEHEESQRLFKKMHPKQIAVCEDETFHPEVCLVAIEPVSN